MSRLVAVELTIEELGLLRASLASHGVDLWRAKAEARLQAQVSELDDRIQNAINLHDALEAHDEALTSCPGSPEVDAASERVFAAHAALERKS